MSSTTDSTTRVYVKYNSYNLTKLWSIKVVENVFNNALATFIRPQQGGNTSLSIPSMTLVYIPP